MSFAIGTKVVWYPGRKDKDYRPEVLDAITGRVCEVLSNTNDQGRLYVDFGLHPTPTFSRNWDVHELELKVTNGVLDAKLGSIIPI